MLKTFSIALAGAALIAAPAVSAKQVETQTIGVDYHDLDLTTEGGRVELDRRIDRAAKQVCGMNESTVGTRIRDRDSRQCYRSAKRELEQHIAQVIEERTLGG